MIQDVIDAIAAKINFCNHILTVAEKDTTAYKMADATKQDLQEIHGLLVKELEHIAITIERMATPELIRLKQSDTRDDPVIVARMEVICEFSEAILTKDVTKSFIPNENGEKQT